MEIKRPNLYVGSKVRVWTNPHGLNDDVVQTMETFVCILFERSQHTMSEDGYGDSYGFLKLNDDGTADHPQWWVDGDECTVIDNDLAANQDFVYANRNVFEFDDEDADEEDPEDEPEMDDEDVPDEPERDAEDDLFQRLKLFVYNVERSEMVTLAKKHGIAHEGVDHRALGIALMSRLPAETIDALIDGEI